MNESSVYNETDLAPFHRRLAELRQIIHQDAESNKHPKAITKLLERQLNECGLSILSFMVYAYILKDQNFSIRSCRGEAATRLALCPIPRTRTRSPETGDHTTAACHSGR